MKDNIVFKVILVFIALLFLASVVSLVFLCINGVNPDIFNVTREEVVAPADTTVSIDGKQVYESDVLIYTITFTNVSGTAADVTITDTIPANVTYVDGSADNGGTYADGAVTWTLEGVPAWGFRYLQTVPGVTMVLSGMSNEQQLLDNIATFATERPLNEQEMNAIMEVAADMSGGVPCTSCRYCTTVCPSGLDIPELIGMYNEHVFSGGGFLAPMFVNAMHKDKRPSACIGCRACERMCPQNIKISEVMADFIAMLEKKD